MAPIKARWPRLVMPDGFIDRDLTLGTTVWSYHLSNLFDLLTVYPLSRDQRILDAVRAGVQFCTDTAFLDYLAAVRDPVVPYLIDCLMMLSRIPGAVEPNRISALARRILQWGYWPTPAAAGADPCVTPVCVQTADFDPRRAELLSLNLSRPGEAVSRLLLLNLSEESMLVRGWTPLALSGEASLRYASELSTYLEPGGSVLLQRPVRGIRSRERMGAR
jgi:hypothetical protein